MNSRLLLLLAVALGISLTWPCTAIAGQGNLVDAISDEDDDDAPGIGSTPGKTPAGAAQEDESDGVALFLLFIIIALGVLGAGRYGWCYFIVDSSDGDGFMLDDILD